MDKAKLVKEVINTSEYYSKKHHNEYDFPEADWYDPEGETTEEMERLVEIGKEIWWDLDKFIDREKLDKHINEQLNKKVNE